MLRAGVIVAALLAVGACAEGTIFMPGNDDLEDGEVGGAGGNPGKESAAQSGGSGGSASCAAGETACGGECVDVESDPANCGGCGIACPAPDGTEASCAQGTCTWQCQAGRGDCDGNDFNGCEVDLGSTLEHCGACEHACATPANGTPGCNEGTCTVASCEAGFDDCDGNTDNGCETELAISDSHCGACGNACPPEHLCVQGSCHQGLLIQVEGPGLIPVICQKGDHSCQAREICEKITGHTCVHQDYDCATGNQGSWYPLDGASGSSQFNFAYKYDLYNGNYGNICACNEAQMAKYGLAANHTSCGLGRWYRQ